MAQEITGRGVTMLTISVEQSGQRIDNFLLARLKGVPRSRIYRLLRKGEVRVNKKRIKAEYRLQEGDEIRVPPVRTAERGELPPVSTVLGELLESAIIYSSDELLVLNKPSGLASHGGTGVTLGLVEAARQVWNNPGLELAHRLDKGTSGCIILTRNLKAQNFMTSLFRQQQVQKTYHALVEGSWPAGTLEVDAPLLRGPEFGGDRRVSVSEAGKSAMTQFTLLQAFDGVSLIEARPASGRTHQIRVHAALKGHPLLGDSKYAPENSVKLWKNRGIKRLCLHASGLSFITPDGETLSLTAPYEESFRRALDSVSSGFTGR